MPAWLEMELDRLGVIARRAPPPPRPADVRGWKPSYPGEDPPW